MITCAVCGCTNAVVEFLTSSSSLLVLVQLSRCLGSVAFCLGHLCFPIPCGLLLVLAEFRCGLMGLVGFSAGLVARRSWAVPVHHSGHLVAFLLSL